MPERMVEWALGFFATAWLGLLSLTHMGQNKRIDNAVPRPEYEAEKENVDKRFDRVDEGITGVHKRLDTIFSQRRTDRKHDE